MRNHARIAVSLPLKTLRALERARRHARLNRSAAVTTAIDAWVRRDAVSEKDREYVEAYLRTPERPDPRWDAVAAAVLSSWDSWEDGR